MRNDQGRENNVTQFWKKTVIYFAFVNQQENPFVEATLLLLILHFVFGVAESWGHSEVVCAMWCLFKKLRD